MRIGIVFIDEVRVYGDLFKYRAISNLWSSDSFCFMEKMNVLTVP